ncbi:NAD(P)/FAD-dependent oxidoreductase [Natronorarus salvus]|uniref:NAD(P)/FAD-dependent oxidoreductase n=1 Tax=Natronorarus salvus TaxID=3117733 RepID=UPI002F267322
MDDETEDVLIVGGGVAGLTAGIFTARAGIDTLIVDDGESILRRNAHLENYPGFPMGIDPRLFLEMTRAQAEGAGCSFHEGRITQLDDGEGFTAVCEDGTTLEATYVIVASWSDSSYLEALDVDLDRRGNKGFVETDADGRTTPEGLYAAGRMAKEYHQTVIAAGHGASVALTLIHDSDVHFYNDWVVPEGYFTDRGIDVPPGIEEIDDDERRARAETAREAMCEWLAEAHDEEPTPHPSLADD